MQTKRQKMRMCRYKNVANYRQKNNGICVLSIEIKDVVDIFARINDVYKMGMFTDVDWKMWKMRKMFESIYIKNVLGSGINNVVGTEINNAVGALGSTM